MKRRGLWQPALLCSARATQCDLAKTSGSAALLLFGLSERVILAELQVGARQIVKVAPERPVAVLFDHVGAKRRIDLGVSL
jgi:hypothetical protein